MEELKENLSKLCGIPVERLAIADVYRNKIYKVLTDNYLLRSIRKTDVIYAYEMEEDYLNYVPGNNVNNGPCFE